MQGLTRRGALGVVNLVVFVLTGVLVFALLNAREGAVARPAPFAYPPLPADAGTHRLLALPADSHSTSYAFLETLPDGSPVTYDPCRPLHYVISTHDLPAYGVKMVQEAVARASAASGLSFRYDGPTSEVAGPNRPLVQKDRYGDRWAPVLIGFNTADEQAMLGRDVMGRGGSSFVAPEGPASARYVTGKIVLDRDDFDRSMHEQVQGFAEGRAVVMHELGHVLGLDHVHDPLQLMDAANSGFLFYGPGDLRGLALEGSGLCHHDT